MKRNQGQDKKTNKINTHSLLSWPRAAKLRAKVLEALLIRNRTTALVKVVRHVSTLLEVAPEGKECQKLSPIK